MFTFKRCLAIFSAETNFTTQFVRLVDFHDWEVKGNAFYIRHFTREMLCTFIFYNPSENCHSMSTIILKMWLALPRRPLTTLVTQFSFHAFSQRIFRSGAAYFCIRTYNYASPVVWTCCRLQEHKASKTAQKFCLGYLQPSRNIKLVKNNEDKREDLEGKFLSSFKEMSLNNSSFRERNVQLIFRTTEKFI